MHVVADDRERDRLGKAVASDPDLDRGSGFTPNGVPGLIQIPVPRVVAFYPHDLVADQHPGALGGRVPEHRRNGHSSVEECDLDADSRVVAGVGLLEAAVLVRCEDGCIRIVQLLEEPLKGPVPQGGVGEGRGVEAGDGGQRMQEDLGLFGVQVEVVTAGRRARILGGDRRGPQSQNRDKCRQGRVSSHGMFSFCVAETP